MGRWQGRSKRKATGARVRLPRKKRISEMGRPAAETVIGQRKIKLVRVRGGKKKIKAYIADSVNVSDQSTGKTKKAAIKELITNPASTEYTRRKIITKGAIINTDLGKVRVTSRPGQDGIINGIIVRE
ncbi:MAG TPA: 30S ribosomal protein S8e [Candidatus Deferrimicrobium sp.]|nr:30S ribosomal protein S8e [Candidatus Deferrimicrobium sp.]